MATEDRDRQTWPNGQIWPLPVFESKVFLGHSDNPPAADFSMAAFAYKGRAEYL